jgi:uncharacterized membrane protein YsdA (DUF1294 family)
LFHPFTQAIAMSWTTATIIAIVMALFWLVNILSWMLMRADRDRAIRNDRRIPESTLLLTALLGGSIGTKLAQRRFRHKTRKEPFRTIVNLILAGQIMLAALLVHPASRNTLTEPVMAVTAALSGVAAELRPASGKPQVDTPRFFQRVGD